MEQTLWQACLDRLERELSEQQLNTWIRPLHALEEGNTLRLLAPNHFVLDWVKEHHLNSILGALQQLCPNRSLQVLLEIGSSRQPPTRKAAETTEPENAKLA